MRLWTVTVAFLLSHVLAHDHQRALEVFHVSEGHLFILPCSPAGQQRNVTWSRDGQELDQVARAAEVQEGQLWFRPAHSTHSGVYSCHYRSHRGESRAQMELSVSRDECPFAAERRLLTRGATERIPCRPFYLYTSFSSRGVRWVKGCAPLNRPGAPVRVNGKGQLWLPEASSEDGGTYTCFIDVSVGGQNYSAAWSVEVTLSNKTVHVEPHVLYPRDQVLHVELGSSVALRCLADLGYSEDPHTVMYWLLNHSYAEDHPGLSESWHFVQNHWRVQGLSTLLISNIHRGLLDVSIECRVQTPVGGAQGRLWLTQADPGTLHPALLWCGGLGLALLVLSTSVYCCRMELVLTYRKLRRHLGKHYVADEKLYDGVVSCVHPPGLLPPDLSLFSLKLLPQRLEGQWGFRLYVRGRDDCPGEAMHDALSDAVKRSHRLLLLLGPSRPKGALQPRNELQPLCYEQTVGLHDALVHKELRVILIEVGGPIDYCSLPESVQYLQRTQGALQWKPRSRLAFLLTERSFWNSLRYHMPTVPSGRSVAGPFSPSSPSPNEQVQVEPLSFPEH